MTHSQNPELNVEEIAWKHLATTTRDMLEMCLQASEQAKQVRRL
jgi:hypothetical protein